MMLLTMCLSITKSTQTFELGQSRSILVRRNYNLESLMSLKCMLVVFMRASYELVM